MTYNLRSKLDKRLRSQTPLPNPPPVQNVNQVPPQNAQQTAQAPNSDNTRIRQTPSKRKKKAQKPQQTITPGPPSQLRAEQQLFQPKSCRYRIVSIIPAKFSDIQPRPDNDAEPRQIENQKQSRYPIRKRQWQSTQFKEFRWKPIKKQKHNDVTKKIISKHLNLQGAEASSSWMKNLGAIQQSIRINYLEAQEVQNQIPGQPKIQFDITKSSKLIENNSDARPYLYCSHCNRSINGRFYSTRRCQHNYHSDCAQEWFNLADKCVCGIQILNID